jgi:hypothetical protein
MACIKVVSPRYFEENYERSQAVQLLCKNSNPGPVEHEAGIAVCFLYYCFLVA